LPLLSGDPLFNDVADDARAVHGMHDFITD
jgi:hypothetical protein